MNFGPSLGRKVKRLHTLLFRVQMFWHCHFPIRGPVSMAAPNALDILFLHVWLAQVLALAFTRGIFSVLL